MHSAEHSKVHWGSCATARTLNGDDMHALHGVQGAEAGVHSSVHDLASFTVGQHDGASSAATLAASQLRAGQSALCEQQGHSVTMSGPQQGTIVVTLEAYIHRRNHI